MHLKTSCQRLSLKPCLSRKTKAKHATRRYNVTFSSGKDFSLRTSLPPKSNIKKRVTFSDNVVQLCVPSSKKASDPQRSWYNDQDFATFQRDSRQVAAEIRKQYETNGADGSLDPNKYCIEGLHRYLSPEVEEALRRRSSEHIRNVLINQEHERQAAKSAKNRKINRHE